MEISKRQVECIVEFDVEGNSSPFRLRYIDNGDTVVVEFKCKLREKKKLPGEPPCIIFSCETVETGVIKAFRLKFIPDTMKWYLI